MARDINDIQRDIERTRNQLASTIDEIADRTKPENVANNAKKTVTAKLQDPAVKKVLIGVGAGVAALVLVKFANGRKKKKELKELQRLLANR
ncbi:DUF3618 domain-containing protein [Corynebacterium aquatimens]|uniref:Prefoldin subunit 5 n=1 Tax=Corynebacterium aquatimens TaxID=1190508 RepID=A0A931E0W4_9CORY|nr:DUF3618 domain-containing protein [Corynebacterium aquatimens]MBG6122228.1 prefoldin subunit 5 [Corynebacterium aquatimens]WJY65231.1 hypothetical protein CAQUA_02545 [Corynebacterium aquatimens]